MVPGLFSPPHCEAEVETRALKEGEPDAGEGQAQLQA